MVALPTFARVKGAIPGFARRNAAKSSTEKPSSSPAAAPNGVTADSASDGTLTNHLAPEQIKRATRTRKIFAILCAVFLFLTVLFLILVEIGNTHIRPGLTDIYFLRLDLSHIIPVSVPNAVLINSIAQTLGLHDFYQVGLWNFCEGYANPTRVTSCSKPVTLYYFNPVEILQNELLAGASIQLPANITDVLNIVRLASHIMFGFFLTGAVLSTVLIVIVPLSVYTRWASLPISILTFINALMITAATIIATVMFIIFKNVVTSVAELNIGASLGQKMFAFMWIATVFAIFTWLIQTGQCCCCASRRDVKSGRRKGSKKAYEKTT